MSNIIRTGGSFESTAPGASYTDVAGAYLDLGAGGTFAQVGAKGPGSIGVKIRTVLAGVALTVLTFAAAGGATFVGAANIMPGGRQTAGGLTVGKLTTDSNPGLLTAEIQLFLFGNDTTAPLGVTAVIQDDRAAAGSGELHFVKSRALGAAAVGDGVGHIHWDFINSAGSSTANTLGTFIEVKTTNVTAGAEATVMQFGVNIAGGAVEVMRISEIGSLLIGTTSASGSSANGIHAIGAPQFDAGVTATKTGAAFQTGLAIQNLQALGADVGPEVDLVGVGVLTMASMRSGWNAAANTNAYLSLLTRRASALTEAARISSGGVLVMSGAGSATPWNDYAQNPGSIVMPNAVSLALVNAAGNGIVVGLRLNGSDHHRIDFATQNTIGANGAASALTANPVGYAIVDIGGTERIIPFYTK